MADMQQEKSRIFNEDEVSKIIDFVQKSKGMTFISWVLIYRVNLENKKDTSEASAKVFRLREELFTMGITKEEVFEITKIIALKSKEYSAIEVKDEINSILERLMNHRILLND